MAAETMLDGLAECFHYVPMRALFECRLAHIGRFDRVKMECTCGREVLLSLDAFNRLPSDTRLLNLKRRLGCESCGARSPGLAAGRLCSRLHQMTSRLVAGDPLV